MANNHQLAEMFRKAQRDALRQIIHDEFEDSTLDDLLFVAASTEVETFLKKLKLAEVAELLLRQEDKTTDTATKQKKQKRRSVASLVRAELKRLGKGRAEDIRAATGGTPAEVRVALFELRKAKLARRTGKGRATVWHWIG